MFGFALRMMILGFHLNSRSKLTVEGIPNNVMSWPITKPKHNSKQDTMGIDEEQKLEASYYVQQQVTRSAGPPL